MDKTTTTIKTLRSEAGEAGDLAMVAICDRALDGDRDALAKCLRVIEEAADRALDDIDGPDALAFVHPDDRARVLKTHAALAGQRLGRTVENLIRHGCVRKAAAQVAADEQGWDDATPEELCE